VFGKTSTMRKDWSFSAFIEYSDKRILFDMGKTKGIDRIVPSPAYR
jgi:metal-dependent hydrolase (beta-lactamase superfamily II)